MTDVSKELPNEPVGMPTDEQRAQIAEALTRAQPAPADVVERLKEVTALLMRYRMETPTGHSPHMICHQADAAIERANATIQALAHKEGNENG